MPAYKISDPARTAGTRPGARATTALIIAALTFAAGGFAPGQIRTAHAAETTPSSADTETAPASGEAKAKHSARAPITAQEKLAHDRAKAGLTDSGSNPAAATNAAPAPAAKSSISAATNTAASAVPAAQPQSQRTAPATVAQAPASNPPVQQTQPAPAAQTTPPANPPPQVPSAVIQTPPVPNPPISTPQAPSATIAAPPTPTVPIQTPTNPIQTPTVPIQTPVTAPAPAASSPPPTNTVPGNAVLGGGTTTTVVVPGAPSNAPAPARAPDEPIVSSPKNAVSSGEPVHPVIERGSGQFFNAQSAQRLPLAPQPGGDVTFNFENESLQAVVKAILGDVMQENYVIAPGVQGNVTFATAKPINANQALSVLEMLLAWNNATLVYRDGRYTVLPVAQALPGNLTPRFGPVGDARGFEVRVVPLRYVSPTEMEKLLQPYARPGAMIRADNARAFLVLGGTKADLQNYLDTIETFDVNWLAGMSVGIYPLERVEAKVVAPELEKIFGDSSNTPLAGMFRFMPIERLNAILVITPQPSYLEAAQQWLTKLDRGGSEAGSQIYVYYVKNVKAKDLAANLSDIFGGGGHGGSTKSAAIGAVMPGVESVEVRGDGNEKKDNQPATRQPSRPEGINAVSSSDIRITAIEESNALLIKATAGEYDAILKAITRLDVVPLQVHIETRILLVDLTDNLSLGVEWFFGHSTSSDAAFAYRTNNRGYGDPNRQTRDAWNSFAGTVGAGGVKWTFLNASAEALLSSLQTNGRARVLSAPSLVVLNNKKASINVGKQIPVVSSFINTTNTVVSTPPTTGTGEPTFNPTVGQSYVQFRDTGIILHVTPRVNPGGLVYMEINQEQSTPGDASTAIAGNVPVDKRVVDTEIAVQSGQTVLLGGLISDTEQQSKNGVPGISRIPILGALFGSQSRNHQRQELLVMITPTVIESATQAQDLTDEYKNRFNGLKPLFIQPKGKGE